MTEPIALFVTHSAARSGAELTMLEVVTRLEGYQPVVLVGEDGPLGSELRSRGVAVEVVPLADSAADMRRQGGALGALGGLNLLRWGHSVVARAHARQAAVLVADSLKAGVAIASTRHRPAFVWSVHDRISADYLGPIPLRTAQFALRTGPDLVVANSAVTAAACPPVRPVEVIPPSVAPMIVHAGSPELPLAVAVVGRLCPWKGQDHALRSFAEAFPRGSETLRFIGGPLFGEQAYASELTSLVNASEVAARVSLLGHVDDVAGALDGVHAVVHASSLPEPFGRTVVEAMSAGLAVVAMNAGGPAEVIHHDVDGILVPPGDVGSLADALRRLAGDPQLRARLGAAAQATAETYTPDRAAPRWRNALDRARAIHR